MVSPRFQVRNRKLTSFGFGLRNFRPSAHIRPEMASIGPSPTIESGASRASHAEMANALRALAMDAVEAAKSGHPGMPMGMADVATVLFTKFLKFDPVEPNWPDRDRFVLSAGH